MNLLLAVAEADNTRAAWSARIIECWRESLLAIIETGRLISRAKEALPHGEFLALVAHDLPFSDRTAQRLMAIGADGDRLLAHADDLPARWSTLYQITRLGDAEFHAKLADGTIGPDMALADLAPKVAVPMSDAEAAQGESERGRAPVDSKVKSGEGDKPLPNGARSICATRQEPDDSLDFFPTPPWATRALIERVFPQVGARGDCRAQIAGEPACGEGHIAEVLREYFNDVVTSDVHHYGYECHVADFLDDQLGLFGGKVDAPEWIITNPPFGAKGEEFALKALKLARVGVAMFFRAQFLEGVGRYESLFRPHPPALVAQFVERCPCHKGRWEPDGDTMTAYVWIVWLTNRDRTEHSPTRFFWIPPGCREALTKPDDVERFTQHPVRALPANVLQPSPAEPEPAWRSPLAEEIEDIPAFLRRTAG